MHRLPTPPNRHGSYSLRAPHRTQNTSGREKNTQEGSTDSPSRAPGSSSPEQREAPSEEPQPEPQRGAQCHPPTAGNRQPAPVRWHSPAMNLMVLMRGRTRKQNLCARGARAPCARPFPAPLPQHPWPSQQRPPCTGSTPRGLAGPPRCGHSLVAGAGGRPALHLVQLVHVVLLQGEAGAGQAAGSGRRAEPAAAPAVPSGWRRWRCGPGGSSGRPR